MADRGEYRAIRRVLLDGPDFRRLTERARWVFVVLKLNFGPAGIEVWYPPELLARLVPQTGGTPENVTLALAELEDEGWIRREANVLWIVGHLEHDPHVTPANPKHRKMVQQIVGGLPRIDVVRAFIRHNEAWFSDADADLKALGKGIRRVSRGNRKGIDTLSGRKKKSGEGIDTLSNHEPRLTKEDITPLTSFGGCPTDDPPNPANGAGPEAPWPARISAVLAERGITAEPGKCGGMLKAAVKRYGADRVVEALEDFLDNGVRLYDQKPQFVTLEAFCRNPGQWVANIVPIAEQDPEQAKALGIRVS